MPVIDPRDEIARLNAELAAANQRLSAWETALDSWMVTNWIGVYERERGVSETLSLCLEKALDKERDTLKAELAAANEKLASSQERERVLREAVEFAIEHGDFFSDGIERLMKALGEL